MNQNIQPLPFSADPETKTILKKLTKAHQALAELKGLVGTIPNENILINTLALQEAKDSSAIENIITTHDDLYQSDATLKQFTNLAAKEVHNYATALRYGFEQVRQHKLLSNNHILNIQAIIEENDAGYRKLPGTVLKNEQTNQVIYTPPQHPDEIQKLMNNLEQFLNNNELCNWDDLTKMAIAHHQFESIHPFYDGNGRTGRIINILYLVKQDLLQLPVLYLSRYINQNRALYYQLLQETRNTNNWENWLLFMLKGIEQTSRQTINLIKAINQLMENCKETLREALPKIYSQDLINNLFRHPYTKIDLVMNELDISRKTASKYLNELTNIGILSKHKLQKHHYFINNALFQLLQNQEQAQ